MANASIMFAGLSLFMLLTQSNGLANKGASSANQTDVPRVAVAGTSIGGRVAAPAKEAVTFPNEVAPQPSGSGIFALPMMALLFAGVALGLLQTRQGQELASSFGIAAPQGQWTKMPLKDLESGHLFAMGLPLVNQAVGALGGLLPAFPSMRRGHDAFEMEPALNSAGYAYSDAGSDCDLPEAELKVRLNDPWESEEGAESETPKQQCLLPDFDPSEPTESMAKVEAKEEPAADPWGFPPMQKMSLDDMGLFDPAEKPAGMDDFFDDEDDF